MRADEVIAKLVARAETVATCESLTGGLIGGALTAVPGSSAVVRGGLITYATALKIALAGVDPELIARHGVVSAPVARAMAEGARRVCQANWGIGVTGVAGPGPADGVASGTVWVSVSGAKTATVRLQAPGDRAAVRSRVVQAGLDLLGELLG